MDGCGDSTNQDSVEQKQDGATPNECFSSFGLSFEKKILRAGNGFIKPVHQSLCTVDVICESHVEQERITMTNLGLSCGENIELKLGSAKTHFMSAVEKCITTMSEGETAYFNINLTESQTFSIKISLKKFSQEKPIWQLSSQEKYNLSLAHKEKGTHFFNSGNIEAAFLQYCLAVKYLICIQECSSVLKTDLEPEVEARKKVYLALKTICYLNIAACHSKVNNHHHVIAACNHVLELDKTNVKALYRRAKAFKDCNMIEEAKKDLQQALKYDTRSKAVADLLQEFSIK
ncbi:uncharacterized protein LOC131954406 [Physella acuta]|uniref:uncharacterized protein LOC131954406 n=1 Tax=Physella acuta TaxID=109671 RepID=UPI0027DBF93A|nr:uncharacterized protein LOC131954406 [Physella acuta]XP_059174040.1 uncharacterized protein LOC131954406 [Physella acuta]XP_059174041.1 uncharacterized protein LOC131954406 [Physella acuta]